MRSDWVVTLGKEHGGRVRVAELTARAAQDAAAEMSAQSLERWTRIVAVMTRIVGAYNVAFERQVLNADEDRSDPDRPSFTIQTGAGASPSLSASLEGPLICVHSRDAQGVSCATEFRLSPDRDDDQTAMYVLQQWMERL